MSVYNVWKATCDKCNKPAPEYSFTQGALLKYLRFRDWKCKRVSQSNGYTKLEVICPECLRLGRSFKE